MTAAAAVLDPAASSDDAFVAALIGLDRLCRRLAPLIDAAIVAGEAGDPTVAAPPALRDDVPDDLVDAVLGLASARTTVALVVAALAGEPGDAGSGADAAWSRELLR